jgi:hypothetical protein
MKKEIDLKYSDRDLFSMLYAYLAFYNREFIYRNEVDLIKQEGDKVFFRMTKFYEKLSIPLEQLEKFKFVIDERPPVDYDKLIKKRDVISKLDSLIVDMQVFLDENRSGTKGFAIGSVLHQLMRSRDFFEKL